jgi:uncharacterized protein (DUF58 family)
VVSEVAATLDAVAPGGSSTLGPALLAARGAGRVVLITDFLGDLDDAVRAAAHHSAAGGEVHAVHVVAAEELDPPASGVAVDPERPELRRPLSPAARAAYLAAFADWRAELARELRAAGAAYTIVDTSEPAAHAIRRIVAPTEPGRGTER